jgi:hypothetical protein
MSIPFALTPLLTFTYLSMQLHLRFICTELA